MCFNATSSLLAGGSSYGVAAYLLKRSEPRLKFAAGDLPGILAMQWAKGALFLLWWRPFWQSVLIESWGWFWAVVSFLLTDSAAGY